MNFGLEKLVLKPKSQAEGVKSGLLISQHKVIVLSLTDSPSSVLGASSVRVLVLAWGFGREGVVQI